MSPYLIVTGDFTSLGGMDAGNHALARYLAQRDGAEVHLVAHRVATDLEALPTIHIHRVLRLLGSNFISTPALDWTGQFWARKLARRRGRTIVNGGNCRWNDVNWVHYVHSAYPVWRVGSVAGRIRSRLSHRLYLGMERKNLARSRLIITNSNRTREDVLRQFHRPRDVVHTVYYGCDPTRLAPPAPAEKLRARSAQGWPANRLTAVFIGALGDRRKGFDALFSAWERLCADPSWDVNLAVIGSGAELPSWRLRLKTARLEDRISFLGFRHDVPEILKGAVVLVHPARYEAYGLAVHEALCCGLPAVVSAEAGVAERYPRELRELLIPDPDKSEQIIDRLRLWRSDIGHYQKEMESFSAQLRSYTWNDMAREMVALIEHHGLP